MKSGTVLDVQLVDAQGKPLTMPDVSIDVVFYSGGKERYRFDAGATDAQGRISTSYDTLERARKENQAFALMDYNTKLEDCDDQLELTVPTLDQLRERLAAVRKWFPENEPKLLAKINNSRNGSVAAASIKKVITSGIRVAVQLPVQ